MPRLPTVDKARAWMAGNASVEEARAIRTLVSGDGPITPDSFKGEHDMGNDTYKYMSTREVAAFPGPLPGARSTATGSAAMARISTSSATGFAICESTSRSWAEERRCQSTSGAGASPAAGAGRYARDSRRMTAQSFSTPRNSGLRIRFARSGYFALLLAALSGCGLAEVERAQLETGRCRAAGHGASGAASGTAPLHGAPDRAPALCRIDADRVRCAPRICRSAIAAPTR